MVLSTALASLLAVPSVAAPPAPGPAAAPAAEVMAPTAAAPAVAPAPAPAVIPPPTEPAPRTVVVPPFEAGDSWATPAPSAAPAPAPTPIMVEAPAPVVVTVAPAPAPVLAPTLSPPAPTWGPVRPMPPARPDAATSMRAIRKWRRSAAGVFTLGSLGMAGAVGLQWARANALQRCINDGSGSTACGDFEEASAPLGQYSAIGMAMFVTGTAGAGVMLGNAAATRDVQLNGGNIRKRRGAKLLGGLAIGASVAWMVGANWTLLRHEASCEGDPRCLAQYRPLRWAANDGAALGIGAGAGLLGYAIAYERQGKALMRLRAAPSVSATQTGVAVRVEF